jgi:hypothetical protein
LWPEIANLNGQRYPLTNARLPKTGRRARRADTAIVRRIGIHNADEGFVTVEKKTKRRVPKKQE